MHACRMAGAEPVFRDQSLYRDSWYLAAGESLRSVVLLLLMSSQQGAFSTTPVNGVAGSTAWMGRSNAPLVTIRAADAVLIARMLLGKLG